jgi:tRNA(Ile)-lysidine synthase
MSKKNSNVNLKNGFKDFQDLSIIFLNFKSKLDVLKKKNYVVAVSGGPDSLALVALTKAYSFLKKTKFHYVLINHNIRKNSYQEAQKVKKLLKKKNINLKIFNNKKKIVKNIQSEARNARYDILLGYCKKKKANILLTAHNLEDQVETFLIRLSRGSGLNGLSAMKPIRKISNKVNLCRPLLDIKKHVLKKISKNVFGTYIKDPSNKNKKFLRTKVRNLKRPLEKSGIKYEQIFRSIQNLSSSKTTLETYLNNVFKNLIKKNDKYIFINIKKYNDLSKDTKIALINKSVKILRKNYYDLRAKKVNNLITQLGQSGFEKTTLGGCIFFKKGKNLCLKAEQIKLSK